MMNSIISPTPVYKNKLEPIRLLINDFRSSYVCVIVIMIFLCGMWDYAGVTTFLKSNFWIKYIFIIVSFLLLIGINEVRKEYPIRSFERVLYYLTPYTCIVTLLLSLLDMYAYIVLLTIFVFTFPLSQVYYYLKKFLSLKILLLSYVMGGLLLIFLCIRDFNTNSFLSILIYIAFVTTFFLYNDFLYSFTLKIDQMNNAIRNDENLLFDYSSTFMALSFLNFYNIIIILFNPSFNDIYIDMNSGYHN